MHSAELNVPQNHVYLFKPQSEKIHEPPLRFSGEYDKILSSY